MPAAALNQGALAQELSAICAQHGEEQTAAQLALTGHAQPPAADANKDPVDLTVGSIQTDGSGDWVGINSLPGDRRRAVISTPQRARNNLAANVFLINKDRPAGLSTTLAQTVLGRLRGCLDLNTPARSKHIGIRLRCQAQR